VQPQPVGPSTPAPRQRGDQAPFSTPGRVCDLAAFGAASRPPWVAGRWTCPIGGVGAVCSLRSHHSALAPLARGTGVRAGPSPALPNSRALHRAQSLASLALPHGGLAARSARGGAALAPLARQRPSRCCTGGAAVRRHRSAGVGVRAGQASGRRPCRRAPAGACRLEDRRRLTPRSPAAGSPFDGPRSPRPPDSAGRSSMLRGPAPPAWSPWRQGGRWQARRGRWPGRRPRRRKAS
jgi:hypothetical protein